MPAAITERHLTLGASPAFHLPDLSGLAEGVTAGPEEEARQETAYFDTADLRLARWGLALRHRDRRWVLAIPNGDGRPPAELGFDGPARRPPEAALALVRAYVRGEPLEQVARLSSRCRRVPLVDGSGRRLADVVDDEVSVLRGRRVAARFRQVEIELQPAGEAVLAGLLERLRGAGAGRTERTPQLLRALGPAAQGEPDVAVPELPADPAAADVVRRAIAAAVQLLLRHDALVRLGGDAEHVHQARVGTRRLRSHLRTFRTLLDRAWVEGLREELGWLAAELGAVRDREVLHERLLALIAGLPAPDVRPAASLAASLAAETEAARGRLLEAMASDRYYALIDRLVEAAAQPAVVEAANQPAARVLPELARRPWRDLRRAVRALPDQPADEELHRVRILAKRARYAGEAAAPALGSDAARYAKLAAALQDVLGEHQDSVTMQAWLRAAAAGGWRRAFVAGELHAMEAVRAAAARARWPKAWRRLKRPSARKWLRR
ncbi:MAG TPA: CYTH and CHAD domain-containing protein [Candidatus Dormibacteraeota bacterium]|nr:CYTH and CHAD domain-containing protein [Candidatus Dormibacteraeota bacterium]